MRPVFVGQHALQVVYATVSKVEEDGKTFAKPIGLQDSVQAKRKRGN